MQNGIWVRVPHSSVEAAKMQHGAYGKKVAGKLQNFRLIVNMDCSTVRFLPVSYTIRKAMEFSAACSRRKRPCFLDVWPFLALKNPKRAGARFGGHTAKYLASGWENTSAVTAASGSIM